MAKQELVSSQHSRLEALRDRHAALSVRVEQAQKRPATTDFFLRQLKKQKLILKEEMEGLRASGKAST